MKKFKINFITGKVLLNIVILLLVNEFSYGRIKLPKLISDGMILQRDADVRIWGWADTGEKICVNFIDSLYKTIANEDGEWSLIFRDLKAGGPYNLEIIASDTVLIKNIMIGDVWVCSGQSNIEIPISRVSWIFEDEISNYENTSIRQFYVPRTYDFNNPHDDFFAGAWKIADSKNLPSFSAVGFFFAKEIYEKYKIPVGLINSASGGTPAEAWMSEDALKEFPEYFNEAQLYKDNTLVQKIIDGDKARIQEWYNTLAKSDLGYKDSKNKWINPDLNTSAWRTMKIPGDLPETDSGPVNGVFWFRKKVTIPGTMTGKPAKLILGRIVDADSAFINGVFVGTVSYQYPPRRYNIPENLLKEGENTIVVKVISNTGRGGFIERKQYEIVCEKQTVDLKGDWHYNIGAVMAPLEGQTFMTYKPMGMYNAMIAPLCKYRIKGVLWYQGESNTGRASEYTKLFTALITDWRKCWEQKDLPFLYVQLPNYQDKKDLTSVSDWALLREAQLKTLAVPKTAMAVTIDVGEWNDLHPLNKKDVGKRLALAARNVAYGEESIVYSGPVFDSFKIEGQKVILSFTNSDNGIICKGGEKLNCFAVAGSDKNFVWANAEIKQDKVIVWSDKVKDPVAVRYAWADSPEGALLYNNEGLPASPFRTDNW